MGDPAQEQIADAELAAMRTGSAMTAGGGDSSYMERALDPLVTIGSARVGAQPGLPAMATMARGQMDGMRGSSFMLNPHQLQPQSINSITNVDGHLSSGDDGAQPSGPPPPPHALSPLPQGSTEEPQVTAAMRYSAQYAKAAFVPSSGGGSVSGVPTRTHRMKSPRGVVSTRVEDESLFRMQELERQRASQRSSGGPSPPRGPSPEPHSLLQPASVTVGIPAMAAVALPPDSGQGASQEYLYPPAADIPSSNGQGQSPRSGPGPVASPLATMSPHAGDGAQRAHSVPEGSRALTQVGGPSAALTAHDTYGGGTPMSPGGPMNSMALSQPGESAAELSALIDRAKVLMGVISAQRASGSSDAGTTHLLQGTPTSVQPGYSPALMGTTALAPVDEQEGDEVEMLEHNLAGAKGSLAAAYAALNRNYDENKAAQFHQHGASASQSLSDAARTFTDTSGDTSEKHGLLDGKRKRSTGSGSPHRARGIAVTNGMGGNGMGGKFLDADELEKLNMLAAAQKVAAYHVQQSPLLTVAQYNEAVLKETKSRKQVRIVIWPMILYFAFILAAGFYFYTRIVFGMGGLTAPLRSYSYFVLFVEILGAINMLFYACWLFARPINRDVFPPVQETGELPPLRRKYTIRVLIPCYKESLSIIQRTVLAARRADKPNGTRVIIYVCDDGADPKKAEWVSSLMDRDVVYITGRDKSVRSKNGKSANLNNTLQLIYPEVRDPLNNDEFMKVPIHELMCLFDADQTCSKGFFTTMMRYIDSGDDVGVALSPQLMFNVVPDCDIFNHQNVHFWEMMQPGMDALGFISLTGTNMIIRSRALCEAGWFPMNTVTEDWALGMRLKKMGWRCRYVDKYLVIGEAPDVTKQAFQQRSRWCKGHFQVFWSEECPLFDGRLGFFHRLAYSSTCASYLSTALSVPVLNLVPVLTILFGWFPIALNQQTVWGITLYYVSLNFLSFYCLSWSHFKALWLSNQSSVILFWPYLKASFQTPVKQILGATMEFKTTLKGSQGSGLDLRVYGMPVLIILINLVSFIIGVVTLDAQINAAKSISLCWIVFNTVPHVLLLLNTYFGPGYIMSYICKGAMALTSAAGILAIVLMWLLYPREVDWKPALDSSITFMQAQMAGELRPDHRVEWRSNSGMQYKSLLISSRGMRSNFKPYENPNMPAFNTTVDLSGGFYEDGPWGPVKLTKNNGLSTAMLAWAMLDAPESFQESRDLTEQSLNVVEHGVEYLKKCYIPDPTDYGSLFGDVYVYQVGDIKLERTLWRRPEDVREAQPVYITGAIEQPTDLTAHMVAGIVAGSLALHKYGRISRIAAEDNVAFVRDMYNVTMETKGVLKHYRSLWRSDSFYDDKLWAGTWMYRASKAGYDAPENAEKYFKHMQNSYYNAIGEHDTYVTDLDYVLNLGVVHAAVNSYSYEFQSPAQTLVWDWICSGHPEVTGLGRVLAEDSPYLGDTVMVAALAQIYANKMKYFDKLKSGFKRGFQCFAQNQARYLIGTDWNRQSYVVGLGKKGYDRTIHRGASCPAWPEECPPDTRGSDRKDANEIKGGVLWLPELTDNPKNTRGGNNTAISLNNNAGMPLLMAALQQSDITWLQCLQNSGAFLPHPVCKSKRPIPIARMGRSERKRFWGYDFSLEEEEDSEDLLQSAAVEKTLPLTRDIGTPLPEFQLDERRFEYDMTSLLGNAFLFYEAQRSGKLPADNKIPWRGDSYLSDGSQHTPPVDLSGGWYDAGDTLKISMPLCATVWRLAWAMMSHQDILSSTSFQEDTNWRNGLRQMEWIAHWLRKARIVHPPGSPIPMEFVIQIGTVKQDHTIETPGKPVSPEAFNNATVPRPVFTMHSKTNGSDLAGEAVAAYAALSMLFTKENPQLSVQLEDDAYSMYALMEEFPNTRYSDSNPEFEQVYPSNQPRGHEFLAAAWMYRMTSDPKFLHTAQAVHAQAGALYHNPVIGWSNPLQEARLVLEEAGPEAAMLQGAQLWLNAHMFGQDASYTRQGLWYAADWGTLRNAALMAHVALRAARIMDTRADDNGEVVNVVWAHHARCFARQQMNYVMGSTGHSFVTGWGFNPPKRPHHRAASCGYVLLDEFCGVDEWNNQNRPFPNTLPGALVGGPNLYDEWKDDNRDYVASEVAIDYNAGLVSGVIGMMQLPEYFWQTTEYCPTFPIAEVDFATSFFKPIPGIKLTRDHPQVISG